MAWKSRYAPSELPDWSHSLSPHYQAPVSEFSYCNGAIARFDGNYQNVSAAWQYSWLGRRVANTLP